MTLHEILERRRSCRRFIDRKVERTVIDELLKMTLTAPSSKNTRSSRLAVIEDRETIRKIAAMRTQGSAFIGEAPLAIAVMGDPRQSDMWLVNCAISATVMQLCAEDLGLGSCWVQVDGRPHDESDPGGKTAEDYLHALMPRTADCRILCVVALGYPEQEPKPRREYDDSDKTMFI